MHTILIVGGTGKTGRRITRRLRAAGRPVRTASRTGGDIAFDLADPATWAPALEGVTAAYVVEPTLQASGDRIPRFVAEAAAAGVRRLVLLSAGGVGEADDSHPLKAAEEAVRASGLDWTILRPDWFSQNFSEGPWLPAVLAGTLSLPTGDGRTPFIDAEDIAEVAAAALTEDRHAGRIYQLTGPRAISFGEAADLIGRATGRTIRYVDVAPEAHIERQVANGIPPGVARLLTGVLVAIRDGVVPEATDDVERALGRPARPFEDYVTETAAAGLWN
ncbi:NAD(P)H-binding protein [Amycolatopsis sp. SID8362]|uniref:NAD(P)H-binding protein n=1 Tax=Amycolatopsis sp. SID8362 TaxID=2690346 RepID=UPI0013687B27|nr:NAD(P)H-binding protein [Amycolatopsis sp. SID8362]NBH03213.1 NAD(P)H-binding protein [Amycolatopsis sp. SID8362]NED39914.1 NAD(P)H-binding protein [Amycolatopsis sp. SID8362]